MKTKTKRIAILGGGPSGMFALKRLLEKEDAGQMEIHIYEKSSHFGCGMPYSTDGAAQEHVTNVSGNEIPEVVTPVKEWVKTVPDATLKKFNIAREHFNDYKVLPRLFFW